MAGRARRGCGVAGATIGLLAILAGALLAPAPAVATDSDLKHMAVLKLRASNGYSVLVLASSERADGRGQVGLIFFGKRGVVTYGAPATITASRFEADLGALGQIALDVAPTGVEETMRSRCGDEPESFSFEPQAYSGSFEFRGEEGFAEVSATSPRDYTRFLFDLGCGVSGSGETGGDGIPGARLRLHFRKGPTGLNLQANKNRPRARTRFQAEIHEKRDGIVISREVQLHFGPGAFSYDPSLGTATLAPPTPFSGRASFHRGAGPANHWTGNLALDFPGRSDVPLTGTGIGATLVPGCFHEDAIRYRC
jgi:hypothetical protein